MLRVNLQVETTICESSSFGRAQPCQGWGGQFEPGLSLIGGGSQKVCDEHTPTILPDGVAVAQLFLVQLGLVRIQLG